MAHDRRLRGVVWRMVGGDSATTDDLLQDAYLKAFRSRADFSGDSDAFGAWLFRITYNCCLDHLKSAARRLQPVADASLESAHVDVPVIPMSDRVAERDLVRRALAELRPDEVAAVVLIDLEGVPYTEAADLLEIPVGTLSSRVQRARAKLREHLSEFDDARRLG